MYLINSYRINFEKVTEMSTLQVTQNEEICARCGFTTTNGREAPDEGILCSRCYSQYDEETAGNLAVDNWLY